VTALKFVFHYPETNGTEGDLLDSGPLDEVARAAERAGFDALSLTEHPAPGARWLASGGHQSLDPLVAFGFAAAATERLRLLTHLVLAPYRNPLLLAKAAATLDKLSGGRLILGLGAGYQKSEFYALGVDMDERGVLFDEVLDCLPLHWSGEPFSYKGRHFEARDVVALPRPVQDPIPIWIGGNSKAARRRVVERAQGWMPMIGSAELSKTTQTTMLGSFADVAAAIREVKEAADTAGRTEPLDFLCSYSDPSIADPTVDVDRHREAFAAMADSGLTWVIVSHPRSEPAATYEFLETFGATYLA
jgi:probable F420-dependent oxidoreductase